MYIPPKPGRLATGAYSSESPIKGEVFKGNVRTQTSDLPVVGGLAMPNDRRLTVYASPMIKHFDTATLPVRPAIVTYYNVNNYTPATLPEIQPHTRTRLMHPGKMRPIVKDPQIGKKSNTPFHPQAQPVARIPRFRTERETAQLSRVSFPSFNNLWNNPNNSFYHGEAQVGSGRIGRGRWNTTKESAV